MVLFLKKITFWGIRGFSSCCISKQRMLQPSSHHITVTQMLSPEKTQDGEKTGYPNCHAHGMVSLRSHPLQCTLRRLRVRRHGKLAPDSWGALLSESVSRSVVPDSQGSHGLQPTRLLRPWDFPGESTGVGFHCTSPTELQAHPLQDDCIITNYIHNGPLSKEDHILRHQRVQTSVCGLGCMQFSP